MGGGLSRTAAPPPPTAADRPPPPVLANCARPAAFRAAAAALYGADDWPGAGRLPVVFDDTYNIRLFGLERLHPFDSCKFGRVVALLEAAGALRREELVAPRAATLEELADVHAPEYLAALEASSRKVAEVCELPLLALLPAAAVRHNVLAPMRLMAGGTLAAAALALRSGWALNVGGGMHHAHYAAGAGWCAYSDIFFAIRALRRASAGAVRRVLVVDTDAHQGNGVARSKLHFQDADTFILDLYNASIWPQDAAAKAGVDVDAGVPSGTADAAYLAALSAGLAEAFARFPRPDLVVYNAGTDVLADDPLGRLAVSPAGVVRRDEAVFAAAVAARAPIVMLLSGGYSKDSAPCIARSVENLGRRFALLPRLAAPREEP
jgi:histone deacetylase 11